MISRLQLENILFLDIETVPQHGHFSDLDPELQQLYADKTEYQRKDEYTAEAFYDRAGIWAEFGKIVCISVGYFHNTEQGRSFRTTSFHGEEKQQLLAFKKLLSEHYNKPQHVLCAHNGKEFDFPFIARRTLINGLKLPKLLDIAGKKPWEVNHLDTMELWKFGDYKHYTSIKLLAALFDIPTPKDDIDGSQVAKVYWEEKDLERIKIYCQKDALTVAQLLLKYKGESLILEKNIEFV